MNSSSPAVDWRVLLADRAEPAAAVTNRIAQKATDLAQREDSMLTSAFAGNDGALAASIALCGSAAVRALVDRFHPHLERAVTALEEQDRRDSPVAQGLANFALLAECMGMPRPPTFDSSLLTPIVPVRKELEDRERRSMAFTALALGDSASALAFLDQKPGKYDSPVLRFEFNQFELIRYLAAAIDARRPADWIEPAWVEYFGLFPMHLAARAAKWPDLFNFVRVLANLRGDRVATLADDIHARVVMAAQSQA